MAREAASQSFLSFAEWQMGIPQTIRNERFWQFIGYQKGLYLYDLAWQDTEFWMNDARGKVLARQLIASADSTCANIEEKVGHGFGKQLICFYTASLGSARETKGRYYRARSLLSGEVLKDRLKLISEVIALLVTEINRQRKNQLHGTK